ncbi:hypothetical protein VaNZ11_015655 [Volvox africanus]|uniref:Distal membrane arm assembly complex 2-like protein n=1 Tax=Volvox africanus TaxID=51714 RepID=A0ABQ5SLA8_9CHLO|nr:hypothetical protein VaNZ11_015655 [Volvox africanus]
MGNICLRGKKRAADNADIQARIEYHVPAPRIWCQKNPKDLAMRPRDTLQDLCIAAVASAWNSLPSSSLEALPADLLQRVFDELVATGRFALNDLGRFKELDLDTVVLVGRADVKNERLRSLDRCFRLRSLDVSGCSQVGDLGVAALRRHCGLRHLKLNQCVAITDAALQHLKGLTCLLELELRECELITGAGLMHLGGLTQLRHLDLDQCRRIKGGLQHLTGLRNLVSLRLGWCSFLTDLEVAWLRCLNALRELRLAYTQVGDEGLAHLVTLTCLTHLDLGGCTSLTDAAASSIQQLTALQVLSLHNCIQFGNAGLAVLVAAPLPSLASLTLSYTAVTTTGLSGLSALSSLTQLSLDSCSVGDAACRVLRRLPCLASLDLSETLVGDGGLDALTVPLTGQQQGLQLAPPPPAPPTPPHTNHRTINQGGRYNPHNQEPIPAATANGVAAAAAGSSSTAVSATRASPFYSVSTGAFVPYTGCSRCSSGGCVGAAAPGPASGPPTSLTHLKLTYTKVTDEGLSKLSLLVGLQHLDLDSGTITDAGLRHVTALSALTSLDLFSCRVSDAGAWLLGNSAHLNNLRTLECCGGLLTDLGAVHLARLTALTCLNLSQNPRLGDAGVQSLAGSLVDLQELSLNHTSITSACLRDLAALSWLRYLSICNTRVSDSSVARMRSRAHADLIIKHSPSLSLTRL